MVWWFKKEWPIYAHILNARKWPCSLGLEGLRGIALLEEVCHWGRTLGFGKSMPGPVSLSLLVDQDCYSSQ